VPPVSPTLPCIAFDHQALDAWAGACIRERGARVAESTEGALLATKAQYDGAALGQIYRDRCGCRGCENGFDGLEPEPSGVGQRAQPGVFVLGPGLLWPYVGTLESRHQPSLAEGLRMLLLA